MPCSGGGRAALLRPPSRQNRPRTEEEFLIPGTCDSVATSRHRAIIEGYAAFNRGDLSSAVQHLHPDIEWIEPEGFDAGGVYRGHTGVIKYLSRSRRRWDFLESFPQRLVDVGEHNVVAVVRTRGRSRSSQRDFSHLIADAYTFEGGVAVRMRAFADPLEAFLALGAEPTR